MRNKALAFSWIGCLTAGWLTADFAQPNLADLLDQEVAAQPWRKALMTHIADPKQQPSSITYCITSGAKPLIGAAGIFTADVPSANVQTPGAPPRVRNHRGLADGMEIPAARRTVLS